MASSLLFSTIEVTRQAFYRTSLSYAIVNMKPIVPGHVLVVPTRPVPRLADLDQEELASLFSTVQKVGSVVERAYKGDGLTIACQDGKAAGQSIEHVHVHILPRRFIGDRFAGANDDIYPAIEKAEDELPSRLKVDADENRVERTLAELEKEAEWLKSFFQTSQQ